MTLDSEVSSDIEENAKFHAQDQDVRPNHRGSKLRLKIWNVCGRTASAGQNIKAVQNSSCNMEERSAFPTFILKVAEWVLVLLQSALNARCGGSHGSREAFLDQADSEWDRSVEFFIVSEITM